MKDNSKLVIIALLFYTFWLIGLTWGILDLDYKVNPPDTNVLRDKDTVYIHDTIYLDK